MSVVPWALLLLPGRDSAFRVTGLAVGVALVITREPVRAAVLRDQPPAA